MSIALDTPTNIAIVLDQFISENKGDQLAVRYRDKRYSFNDVAALMNRAGNMLKRFDIGAGDQVIVAVSPSPSLIASVLGAMKVGATAIVVPDSVTPQTSAKLNAAAAKLLIVDAARLGEFSAIKSDIKRLVVGEAGEGQHSFLQEMRGSASSLSRLAASSDTPALAIANGDKLSFLAHDQIEPAGGNETFSKSEIGNILVHLARGEDVQIS
jgi:acyl-coenzyme A synthetase/AMP-(fatty) acid ligase